MNLTRQALELVQAAAEATGQSNEALASKVIIDALEPFVVPPAKIQMNEKALRKAYPAHAPF